MSLVPIKKGCVGGGADDDQKARSESTMEMNL
mgnify:CR=1 FL=1